MDSRAVALGVQHAHAAGESRGFGQGAVIYGGLGLLILVGVVIFLTEKNDVDQKNAVYEAENRSFSHGVDAAHKEIFRTKLQKSKVVNV
jgi:hypothetical protein